MFVQIASIIAVSALALPQDSGTTRQPVPGAQDGQPGTAQGDKARAEQARHKLMLQRADKLIPAPDCGMKYLPREVAFAKLEALSQGAAIVRKELG